MILPKVTLKADDCTQVRMLDIVKDAILYAHKWAVDHSITATYVKDVTEGLQTFIRDLKRQGSIINVEVYADEERNTASALNDGKAYWNIRLPDLLPTEQSIYRMEVTTQWVPQVLSSKEAAL
jgi:phage tail sheath protein FI